MGALARGRRGPVPLRAARVVHGRGAPGGAVAARRPARPRGHEAWVETVWVRPQWWWSLALHAVARRRRRACCRVAVPVAGVAVGGVALDLLRCSRSPASAGCSGGCASGARPSSWSSSRADPDAIALLLTANTDAPRRGLVFRDGWRRVGGRLRPGPLWWVAIVLGARRRAASVARLLGADGQPRRDRSARPDGRAAAGGLRRRARRRALRRLPRRLRRRVRRGRRARAARRADRAAAREAVGRARAGRRGRAVPVRLAAPPARRPAGARSDTVVLELGPCGDGTPAWTTQPPAARGRLHRRRRVGGPPPRQPADGGGRRPRAAAARGRGPRRRRRPASRRERARTATCPSTCGEGAMERAYDFCLDVVDALDADLAGRPVARPA